MTAVQEGVCFMIGLLFGAVVDCGLGGLPVENGVDGCHRCHTLGTASLCHREAVAHRGARRHDKDGCQRQADGTSFVEEGRLPVYKTRGIAAEDWKERDDGNDGTDG